MLRVESVDVGHPPLEGEGRRACNARRGGVKVSPRERCPSWRLSPHPVEHLTMLADPPPPGEGKGRFDLNSPRASQRRPIWKSMRLRDLFGDDVGLDPRAG